LNRVYDDAGNVIETHEQAGEFKEWWTRWCWISRKQEAATQRSV